MKRRIAISFMVAAILCGSAHAETVDVVSIFAKAAAANETGIARKTKAIDSRPATPGEVITTIIKGEGVETKSKPAEPGDFVVRNRCPETGNEEYLVKAAKFPDRYLDAGQPAVDGWKEYTPKGKEMKFYMLKANEGPYEFTAPWGEQMIAKPGDALVQTPGDEKDTYRVAAASFACTYEIVKAP
ncbi:MAG: hypothetical protein JWL86_3102 [Rhizobium sp.]|nr:hypothetical protein [Rhizobium sp.]